MPDEFWGDLRKLKETVRCSLNKAVGNSFFSDGKDSTSVITSILHFNDSPKVEFSFDVAILAKNSDGDYCRLIHNKNYGIYDQWTWCQEIKKLSEEYSTLFHLKCCSFYRSVGSDLA